jgi:ABC-type multidrug transport system fused ATPase/permease subunit
MSYSLTPIALIAAALFWSGFDGGLDATSAFTALAFIYLAAQPMAAILLSWSKIGGMVACFNRIQAYLLLPEHVDSRDLGEKGPTHDLERFPIQIEKASVASPDGRFLFTADVCFEHATTTMVIGPTGVGKSTMLRSVLGEAKITSGSVYVQTQQIAYCDQEEWICNATIRENIIGCLPYDEVWYNKVAKACLLHDLNEFPLGHLTLAGTRGSNLSGGQRQRVVSTFF